MNSRPLGRMTGFFAILTLLAAPAFGGTALENRASLYQDRYGLKSPEQKRVNNQGAGDQNLYGTRNFRQVLAGVLYRGGANNAFHRSSPRHNSNPLPEDGLDNLCKEGFERAIYLYPTNYSSASPEKRCTSRTSSSENRLEYSQISSLAPKNQNELLRIIFENIREPLAKPIYAHCWNGWHASGYLSALSLMQFCGWTSEAAVHYWNQNTDGVNEGASYERVRQMIRNFQPQAEFLISSEEQTAICPSVR